MSEMWIRCCKEAKPRGNATGSWNFVESLGDRGLDDEMFEKESDRMANVGIDGVPKLDDGSHASPSTLGSHLSNGESSGVVRDSGLACGA